MSRGSSVVEQEHRKLQGGGSNPSPGTILSGHQPIALSRQFVFVPHCDYQPKSWHSHNYIRGTAKPLNLSVPVHAGSAVD